MPHRRVEVSFFPLDEIEDYRRPSVFRTSPLSLALRRSAQAATLLLIAIVATPAQAGFTVFEAAGADAAAIIGTRDAFRSAVGGGTVAGANGSFGGLRREINWDGVPP